jgi:hypothetical protein
MAMNMELCSFLVKPDNLGLSCSKIQRHREAFRLPIGRRWDGEARRTIARISFVALAQAAHSEPAHDTSRHSSRIASIGGTVTEIFYALGLEQRIVAVDATSFYPPQAASLRPACRSSCRMQWPA